MIRFVLDASVALSWLIDHPTSPYATYVKQLLLRDSEAIAPPLWELEIANGLVKAERRGMLTPSDSATLLQNLDVVLRSIEVTSRNASMKYILSIARTFGLSAYDAVYLDLAREERLPIATLDRDLATAAKRAGIPLLS